MPLLDAWTNILNSEAQGNTPIAMNLIEFQFMFLLPWLKSLQFFPKYTLLSPTDTNWKAYYYYYYCYLLSFFSVCLFSEPTLYLSIRLHCDLVLVVGLETKLSDRAIISGATPSLLCRGQLVTLDGVCVLVCVCVVGGG